MRYIDSAMERSYNEHGNCCLWKEVNLIDSKH